MNGPSVLIVTDMFPTTARPLSGSFVAAQAAALRELGVNISVLHLITWVPWIMGCFRKRWRELAALESEASWEGIPVRRCRYLVAPVPVLLNYQASTAYLAVRRLYQWVAEGRFDIVHGHGAVPGGFVAVRLARELGYASVVTCHGGDLNILPGHGSSIRSALQQALAEASLVLTVGTGLAEQVRKSYGRPEVYVVPNGVALPGSLCSDPLAKPTGLHLVSVGSLCVHKGQSTVLQALARLVGEYPGLSYTLVGDGPERRALHEQAKKLRIADHVRFCGALPHRQAMAVLRTADVMVLPSSREGFGIAHLEAMAMGIPTIGCQGQGPADFIRAGENGLLVPPDDPESLTESLRLVLSDKPFRWQLGEKAAQTAASYTWEKTARQVLALYRRVLSLEGKPHDQCGPGTARPLCVRYASFDRAAEVNLSLITCIRDLPKGSLNAL